MAKSVDILEALLKLHRQGRLPNIFDPMLEGLLLQVHGHGWGVARSGMLQIGPGLVSYSEGSILSAKRSVEVALDSGSSVSEETEYGPFGDVKKQE